jgi:hypothetical protein
MSALGEIKRTWSTGRAIHMHELPDIDKPLVTGRSNRIEASIGGSQKIRRFPTGRCNGKVESMCPCKGARTHRSCTLLHGRTRTA